MNGDYRSRDFISVTELGEIMGISRSYAYDFVRSQECPFKCLKMGKRIIIPTNDFLRWYDSLLLKKEEET